MQKLEHKPVTEPAEPGQPIHRNGDSLQPVCVATELLDIDPVQAKRHEGTEAFRRLIDSIDQHGILQSLGLKPAEAGRWRVLIGNGRAMAARTLGLPSVPAVVLGRATSEDEAILQLVENMLRDDLSQYDQWQGCAAALRQNPRLLMKDLAGKLSLDPSSLCRILSPERCIDAVVDALRERKINLGHTYAISKVNDPQEQARLLSLALAGTSRDRLEREVKAFRHSRTAQGKQSTAGDQGEPKQSRVRCPLSATVVVSVQGKDMTLAGYIQALTTALEAAHLAAREKLDIRTAMRVWKDKVRAGDSLGQKRKARAS
jgi:ParB/RepB/Spo0J family partition protein